DVAFRELPLQLAGSRIPRADVASRDVHDAVDDDRCGLHPEAGFSRLDVDHPRAPKLTEIGFVDLRQGGMALVPPVAANERKIRARMLLPIRRLRREYDD